MLQNVSGFKSRTEQPDFEIVVFEESGTSYSACGIPYFILEQSKL
jgi:hypothetical protein